MWRGVERGIHTRVQNKQVEFMSRKGFVHKDRCNSASSSKSVTCQPVSEQLLQFPTLQLTVGQFLQHPYQIYQYLIMHTQNQQFGGDGQVTDLPSNPPSTTSKPPNWVQLLDQPLHSERKLRLVCVGAGFAGLILAHKIKYDWKMDNFIDFQIYEKNPDVGGTWYENRYPGVAW